MIKYHNLTLLINAARRHGFSVHLHLDDQGKPVFSIGCSDFGAAEFSTYKAAVAWLEDRNGL